MKKLKGTKMGLNKQRGNMYGFVTHTWNTIKGQCSHNCGYCYMKRFKNQKPVRFDEKELKTDLGDGNFIFVGSSCDMFANDIPLKWIENTLEHCKKYPKNKYLFQSKNPNWFMETNFINPFPGQSVFATTIETNRENNLDNAPTRSERAKVMSWLEMESKIITIEPIMKFDLIPFVEMLKSCGVEQINIGADSGNNNLPEPTKEEIQELILELRKFTKVHLKPNIERILK